MVVAVGVTFGVSAMAKNMSKDEYKSSLERVSADHKHAVMSCQSLSGNANDICMAIANGKRKIARADLEARKKNTKSAYYDARIVKADANYSIAKEKCDDMTGNSKDVCLLEAKSEEVAAKADAKAHLKTSKANKKADEATADARKEAKENSADARQDANEDKRAAEFSVAKEKCEAYTGDVKDICMDNAKSRFGKM